MFKQTIIIVFLPILYIVAYKPPVYLFLPFLYTLIELIFNAIDMYIQATRIKQVYNQNLNI